MIEPHLEIHIRRGVSEVFALLTTADHHPKWDPRSLAIPPLEPRFREVGKLAGRCLEVLSRVAHLEPDRHLHIESLSSPGWRGAWVFQEAPGGPRLEFTARLTMRGLGRILKPFIAPSLRRDLDRNFTLLEAEPSRLADEV